MDHSKGERFYLPQIDGLRFLAFALVFFHHYAPTNLFIIGRAQSFGWVGVDIFLVISSFLIVSLLLRERERTGTISIKGFYLRRALRIWPLYFPYLLAVWMFLPKLTGLPPTEYGEVLQHHGLPFMTFLGNFSYASFPEHTMLFDHLWTICLEEQFYMLIPIVILLMNVRTSSNLIRWTVSLIAFSMMWRAYFLLTGLPVMAFVNPLSRMDPFIIGALCAAIARENPAWLRKPIGPAFLLAAALLFVTVALFAPLYKSLHTIWQLTLVPAAAAMLVFGVIAPGWLGAIFAWRPVAFLGKISFGLYIYHQLILKTTPHFENVVAGLSVKLIACIGVATISYLLWEKPFLRFKEKFEHIRSRPA